MKPSVTLEEGEWAQVISMMASHLAMGNPTFAKITQQLMEQRKANNNAEGQEQREREHSAAASRGLPASPGNSHRPERSEESR